MQNKLSQRFLFNRGNTSYYYRVLPNKAILWYKKDSGRKKIQIRLPEVLEVLEQANITFHNAPYHIHSSISDEEIEQLGKELDNTLKQVQDI